MHLETALHALAPQVHRPVYICLVIKSTYTDTHIHSYLILLNWYSCNLYLLPRYECGIPESTVSNSPNPEEDLLLKDLWIKVGIAIESFKHDSRAIMEVCDTTLRNGCCAASNSSNKVEMGSRAWQVATSTPPLPHSPTRQPHSPTRQLANPTPPLAKSLTPLPTAVIKLFLEIPCVIIIYSNNI